MLRLTLQAKTVSPMFINQRLLSRKYNTKPTPNGTRQNEKPKDTPSENAKVGPNTGRGGESNLWDQGTFKVDVTKSIGNLGYELGKSIHNLQSNLQFQMNKGKEELQSEIQNGNLEMNKWFAEFKSDQKLTRWQLHTLFFGTASLVVWTLKDYVQLCYPAFFVNQGGTHEHAGAPQEHGKKQ